MAELDRPTFALALWTFCITYAWAHLSPCPSQCCPEGDLLWQQGHISRPLNRDYGIEAPGLELSAVFVERSCPMTALFRANFTAVGDEGICMGGDLCGRRILRMDMYIGSESQDEPWIFEVAEEARRSPGFDNPIVDTVLTGVPGQICLTPSEKCDCGPNFCNSTFSKPTLITVHMSHSFYQVDIDGKVFDSLCWNCLWNLDSTQAGARNSLLIGINRRVLIDSLDSVGNGICDVRFQWLCAHYKEGSGDEEVDATHEELSKPW